MHDEAAPHYIDMIDQTTLGHRFIKQEFNLTPRIGWQIDPFGHSAVQAYLLGAEVYMFLQIFVCEEAKYWKPLIHSPFLLAQVGFDSLFFGRIDYQDRAKRKDEKSLEVVWRGSKSLGSSAQVSAAKSCCSVFPVQLSLYINAGYTAFSFKLCGLGCLLLKLGNALLIKLFALADFCWCIP